MKRSFLLSCMLGSLLQAGCFHHENPSVVSSEKKVQTVVLATPVNKNPELTRLSRYLEHADAIHREAWWVVVGERKVQGRSIFGKAFRALQTEMGIKLGNKSLFRCDRYTVKREVLSPTGLPQKGEIFEKCNNKGPADLIADFEMTKPDQADMNFYSQHLEEVVGLGSSILNRKIHCHFAGDVEGKLESLQCTNMLQDRTPTEVIQFSVYEYKKSGKNTLSLKGQVFENLSPMRKIEAQVPMSGKIEVTETQVEAPEGYTTATPKPVVPVATPKPEPSRQAETNQPPPDGYDDAPPVPPAPAPKHVPPAAAGRGRGGGVQAQQPVSPFRPAPQDPNAAPPADPGQSGEEVQAPPQQQGLMPAPVTNMGVPPDQRQDEEPAEVTPAAPAPATGAPEPGEVPAAAPVENATPEPALVPPAILPSSR